jgi:Undecaprenyl-phosphate glucose phosphotransferase
MNPLPSPSADFIELVHKIIRPRRVAGEIPHIISGLLRVADIGIIFVTGLLTYELYVVGILGTDQPISRYVLSAGLITAVVFDRAGMYSAATLRSAALSTHAAIKGCLFLCTVTVLVGFGSKSLSDVPRGWVLCWLGAGIVSLIGLRIMAARGIRLLETKNVIRETIAIVGAGPLADRLASWLKTRNGVPVEVLGVFDDRTTRLHEAKEQPCGSLDELLRLSRECHIDRIIVTLPWTAENRLLKIIRKLKEIPTYISLCPDQAAFALAEHAGMGWHHVPMLQVASRPLPRWDYLIKRVEDIVIGGALLIMTAPVTLALMIAIKLDSRGPILFKQRRHGFHNQEIFIYKFRSMYWEQSDHTGARQTTRDDKRITRLGRFMRSTSLDELPQLLNVLAGTMSLVGPRPHPVGMRTRDLLCDEIVENYTHRHRVKPGITGLAQIKGYRGATEHPEHLLTRVKYDLQYIDHWSLWLDLKILWITIFKVATDSAAY